MTRTVPPDSPWDRRRQALCACLAAVACAAAQAQVSAAWPTAPVSDVLSAAAPAHANSAVPALAPALVPAAAPPARPSAAATTTGPPVLQVLAPREAQQSPTAEDQVHVLGRTTVDARVWVAGEAATVFSSGIFVRDGVPLALGDNRITINAESADGRVSTQTVLLQRQAPQATVAWPTQHLFINGQSLRPQQLVYVQPGEAVQVAVQATPGQRVRAQLPGQPWQPLYEESPGRYRASLAFSTLPSMGAQSGVTPAPVRIEVQAVSAPSSARQTRSARETGRRLLALTPGAVGQWAPDADRLWQVGDSGAALLHGLHEVRLGGPFLAELPPGTLLHVNGQQGSHLRVQLAPDTQAWVAAADGRWAAPGTAPPQAYFTSLSVTGSAQGDVLQIPLTAAVPYAVNARSDGATHRLEIDLFSTHHATTWVSHSASARVVREVTAEQLAPGRVRLRVALQGRRLWGWRVERSAQALRVVVRPAPRLTQGSLPLAGLRVALEPGHGGTDRPAAVGATGTTETDINRWTTEALKEELEAAGADVVLVRTSDHPISLQERTQHAVSTGAHVYLSMHSPTADVSQGYLRMAGTSTYYKHAHSRDLAAAIQQQVLQRTGLADAGLVGNFNDVPIRLVTWMPAVLVQPAFLSHPGDEALLLQPTFRRSLAQAVRQGLEAFIKDL
jgi:N-acetylmuramoyl-L-alanine amidase